MRLPDFLRITFFLGSGIGAVVLSLTLWDWSHLLMEKTRVLCQANNCLIGLFVGFGSLAVYLTCVAFFFGGILWLTIIWESIYQGDYREHER